MVFRRLIVPFIGAILISCTTAAVPPSTPETVSAKAHPIPVTKTGLVAFGADGSLWLVRARSSEVETWAAGAAEASLRQRVPFPPLAMRSAADDVLTVGTLGSTIVFRDGRTQVEPAVKDIEGEDRLKRNRLGVEFASATGESTSSIEGALAVTDARLVGSGRAIAMARDREGESLYLAVAGSPATRIAGPFTSIQAFDVSPDATEIAFSADRGAGLDVGLVATEGSPVRWIGPDPLVERSVKWAPRGNKIAYVIETPGGSVVRSVHITTGFQVSTPLPLTVVNDLAWDAAGERLALLLTSADAGERVEVMRYDGTERRVAVAPALRAEAPDQVAGDPEAVLFPPGQVRYNQKVPLVVWVADEGPFAWHDARARLQQNRRMGSVVVARGAASHPALWETIAALPWVDPERVFLVSPDVPVLRGVGFHVTVLSPGPQIPADPARMTVVGSDSTPLEKFALLWLGDRLREFEREHDGN